MLKQYLICIVIILIIIILNNWSQNYTKESVKSVTEKLDALKENIIKENYDSIKEKFEEISNEWDDRYEILAYYLEHDELEKVKIELVSLNSNIENEEYEQTIIDINKSIFLLEHIIQKTSLQIKNIF